ncbi:MAG: cupin domain-containing protein [Actinomycetota bacterium]|nr:cupin domain-containing protein [Actinomycetota bacterium]
MRVDKVNVERKFALFDDYWDLRIVGELNGQRVKLAKLLGELVSHHDEEDELFFRRKGTVSHGVRDRDVSAEEGEFIGISRGVEHRPVAEEKAQVMLFELALTLNTGNVRGELPATELEQI